MPEIEKGIPIPPRSSDARRKYPFVDMEVGDSAFFPMGVDDFQKRKQVAASAHGCARDKGRKFTVRNVEGGVRVWRYA
jgi:hypothetical protein